MQASMFNEDPVPPSSLPPHTGANSDLHAITSESSGELSLSTLFEKYRETLTAENKSPKTIEGYCASLNSFHRFTQQTGLAGNLASFNRSTVTQYVLSAKSKQKYTNHPTITPKPVPVSISTINVCLRSLKAFSSFLYREGYTPINQLKGYKLSKAPIRMIQPMTQEEKTKILRGFNLANGTDFRNYVMLLLFLDTGIREKEITLVKLSDINWSSGSILVMGKGSKERLIAPGDNTIDVLKEYIEKHRDKARHVSTDRLFLSKSGKPITCNAVKLMFSRLKINTKIPRLHCHLCRHTFSTDFLNNGGSTLALQQILGHTSLAMVQKYVHLNESQITSIHRRYSPVDHYYSLPGNQMSNRDETSQMR